MYVASQRPSPDPSGKALAGSLLTHGLVIAAVATSGLWKLNNSTWGDVHASSGSVGPGIADALVATAFGLFAAIPAAIFYNHFGNTLKRMGGNMDDFSLEFLNLIERSFGE